MGEVEFLKLQQGYTSPELLALLRAHAEKLPHTAADNFKARYVDEDASAAPFNAQAEIKRLEARIVRLEAGVRGMEDDGR